jgi:hypothetical protein
VDSSLLVVVVDATVLVDGCGTDGVGKTSLASEVETFLGSGRTTNKSVFTVEVLGHLLKWRIPCLYVKHIDNCKLNSEPAGVHNVVLPADSFEGDGVDELVEEQGDIDRQEHNGETLGTDVVGENLSSVTDEEKKMTPRTARPALLSVLLDLA